MAVQKKNPIIGVATKAKVRAVVNKAKGGKAASSATKAGSSIKQEARVIGRAVTGYSAKKETPTSQSLGPASAFQINSPTLGQGKIKSPSELKQARREEKADNREANRMSRSADRTKRRGERANTLSPGSERMSSSKEGLTWNGVSLPSNKRAAIRTISDNAKTKLEGRERMKWAKEQYEDRANKPKTMTEMREQNAKKQKKAGACTKKAGPGVNLCKPGIKEGGF